ncbi:hypothetical protein I4F81_000325 [Pyropia yezoensis]|uniref:Uncharacterized protein n=1 Tax=Pyropia yezoensis TaxID=2788 RepID=A0ACC3BIG9_PYRYE|nr:hypothetical protein I4F81_000325 [Neopyropia yezoensis]
MSAIDLRRVLIVLGVQGKIQAKNDLKRSAALAAMQRQNLDDEILEAMVDEAGAAGIHGRPYNDTSYCPTTPNLIDGIMDVDLRGMNPNRHSGPRDPSKLEAQFRTLRSLYTVALSNSTRSGNNEPIFKRCVRGDHRLLYIHCLLKGNADTDFLLRTVSPAVQCEVGLSCSKQVGTPSSSGRKRPRADEVSIEGMSGLTSALSSVVHCMGAGSAPRTAAADIFDNAEAIGAVRKQLRDAQEDLAADPLDETTASVIWHLKRQLAALMK